MQKNSFLFFFLFLIIGCTPKVYQATTYDYKKAVDTRTKPIQVQEKKKYDIKGIQADNQFDGARLNDFKPLNDSTWQALITPENFPINPSPWFAFKLSSDKPTDIYLQLAYEKAQHRYQPKISTDSKTWKLISLKNIKTPEDRSTATFKVSLTPTPIWIAAQEITTSKDVKAWCKEQAKSEDVTFQTFGKSKMGKDMIMLDITNGKAKNKPVIIILSRQHPPEVTGYFAMQSFIESLIADTDLAKKFRENYRLLVFPLMNPDGVDNGHWRHNTGGVDLNRDWAYYHQPENRQVANHIVSDIKKNKSKVLLGLDFHSTYKDIYYTNHKADQSNVPGFKDLWLKKIEQKIPNYKINERSSEELSPVSKNWFFTQFNADGVTYEIGDNTDRDFIKVKGKASAEAMIEALFETLNPN